MKTYSFFFKNPKEVSILYLSLYENGKREKVSLKIKEDPSTFDKDNYCFLKSNPFYRTLNARLANIKSILEIEIREAEVTQISLPEFRARIEQAINIAPKRKTSQKESFLSYFEKFVYNDNTKRSFSRQRTTTLNRLREYFSDRNINPTFDDIDYKFSEDFISWMSARGLSPNTRGVHIKRIKTAMNEAYKAKLHDNTDFKIFRKEVVDTDNVYLTTDEVEAIAALPLNNGMDKARDLFLLGCHTGMRYSDYSRITLDDIHDGIIHNINKKTQAVVEIPAHPRVISILKKHDGAAPIISQQKFNAFIKDICRMAGITDKVTLRAKGSSSSMEKWEAVTSHTARRTGITNMYKAGVPIYRCMMISGHTTEKVFLQYIKITQKENAELLRSNPFFNS